MSRDDFLTFSTEPRGLVRTTALPTDFCILLTDTLESPATFLLTHFVGRALRDGRKTVLVGLSRGMEHYATILRKSGVQLALEKQKGNFDFITASNDHTSALQDLYETVRTALESLGPGTLLVLDDLTSLLWAGHSSTDVARLLTGLRALSASHAASLVVLMHSDDIPNGAHESDDTHLFRRALQISDLWLQTTSLGSQTRGELSIYRGPALVDDYGIMDRSGPTALLYKLDETGPTFSVKGMARFM